CIRSILAQEGVDVRVLLMDDASTDSTEWVGRRLAADARVEYRRHSVNRGHIATYNEALALMTGDYCLILSADDLLTPGALMRAIGDYLPDLPASGDTEIWLRMAAHADVCELDADQAFRRLHANNMSLDYPPLRWLAEQRRAFEVHFNAYRPARLEIIGLEP